MASAIGSQELPNPLHQQGAGALSLTKEPKQPQGDSPGFESPAVKTVASAIGSQELPNPLHQQAAGALRLIA